MFDSAERFCGAMVASPRIFCRNIGAALISVNSSDEDRWKLRLEEIELAATSVTATNNVASIVMPKSFRGWHPFK